MQSAFISALTYYPPTVLGRQLLHFSSWHGLVLEAAGSPYILGERPGIDDLITCVWICSHDFDEGIAVAGDAEELKRWGKSVKRHSYAAARTTMQEYLTASFVAPEYWTNGSGQSLKAPFWWHAATFAMRELHLPESQAWDFPIARIVCYQACVGEVNGNKDLATGFEVEGIEKDQRKK